MAKVKVDQIEQVSVSELIHHPKNMNAHSEDQISRLVKLIEYQGFRNPLVVQKGTNLVVAGNGRLMAARKMGMEKVPVTYQEFESEAQLYAYMTSDNAIASWAELDLSAIGNEVLNFGDDFDIQLLGLKDFEIEIAQPEPQCDEDEVPTEVDTRCKPGDVWKLGEHRLMCGDSTDVLNYDKLTEGKKPDVVFTDPPYGINIVNVGASSKLGFVGTEKAPSQLAKARSYKPVAGDDQPYDPNLILGMDFRTVILWGANHYASKLPDKPQWLIWDKKLESGDLDHNNFSDCELAWTNSSALSAKIYRHTWAGMVRKGDRKEELSERVHPTQKPVGLCENVLKDFSKDGDIIIDFFGGSGSTLIACEKLGRQCMIMELDPHYCDVIVNRFEKYTGKKAELINGQT